MFASGLHNFLFSEQPVLSSRDQSTIQLFVAMKVLVQNPFTLSYLQAPGKWTSDINRAMTFKDSKSAFQFCDQHGLYDSQVALRFPDERHDVEIPVLSGLPGARQSDGYERFQAINSP